MQPKTAGNSDCVWFATGASGGCVRAVRRKVLQRGEHHHDQIAELDHERRQDDSADDEGCGDQPLRPALGDQGARATGADPPFGLPNS